MNRDLIENLNLRITLIWNLHDRDNCNFSSYSFIGFLCSNLTIFFCCLDYIYNSKSEEWEQKNLLLLWVLRIRLSFQAHIWRDFIISV